MSHPVTITSAMTPAEQTTAANFIMTCDLPRNQKGINMSRLTELLQVYHQKGWILSFSSLQQFTKELAENMDTSSASVEVRFPWFFERKSPKLEKAGLMHADIFMSVTYREDQPFKQRAGISAKVTTLCPCSRKLVNTVPIISGERSIFGLIFTRLHRCQVILKLICFTPQNQMPLRDCIRY
ncbi:GTP cyclohydrolase, FolE2/MptA family [Bacillus stercoris]|nr:GTP cyclohydrolase, FolE2/MptA family [Bacillus stercoris]